MSGCSLPHIALWVLTLPFRLVGWAISLPGLPCDRQEMLP